MSNTEQTIVTWIGDDLYTIELQRTDQDRINVDISHQHDGVGAREWSGSGMWNESGDQIEDCPADLGDDVYNALDEAIADELCI